MKKIVHLAALIIAITQLAACMSFSDRSFRSTKSAIQQQMPHISLEKEFAVSMGRGLFGLLRVISLDEQNISELDHVQIAVYKVDSGGREVNLNQLDFSETLRSRGEKLHWETIIRVRDRGEQVWVLVGMDLERNSLNAVSLFVLENKQLVLINVDGDLERLIEFALAPAYEYRQAADAA
jgi:hypothetical protein